MSKKRQKPGKVKHGTTSRYNNQGCRCRRCRKANAAYQVEYLARYRARGVPRDAHGRYSTYTNYRCRCRACKDANNRRAKEYRRGRGTA